MDVGVRVALVLVDDVVLVAERGGRLPQQTEVCRGVGVGLERQAAHLDGGDLEGCALRGEFLAGGEIVLNHGPIVAEV